MIDTHHIGGFVQNTVKPLIEKLDEFLGECKNLHLSKEEIREMIKFTTDLEIAITMIKSVTWVILGIIGCLTTYFILH